ncbi:MAG: hypothetical protein BIFFINMI_00992 [Phycisphaerae bacterium]|nr:hypothetical protein [Phycisphaerae bacterium]
MAIVPLALRRFRRRLLSIDRSLALSPRPPVVGYTPQQRPVRDWPAVLRVRGRFDADSALRLTTWRGGGGDGLIDAAVTVRSARGSREFPLPCGLRWRHVALPLGGLIEPGRPGEVELLLSGRDAGALQLARVGLGRGWGRCGADLTPGVQGVSFPRSGHHVLVDTLRDYFGDALGYCEFAGGCGCRPCPDPRTNLQKDHDFDLGVPDDGRPFLVQFRHPLPALVSWYGFELRAAGVREGNEPVGQWRDFARAKLDFWRRWMMRWVLCAPRPRSATIAYERLCDDSAASLSAAIGLFIDPARIDAARVQAVARRARLRPLHRLSDFRHYDPAFFRELQSKVADEIRAAGLELMDL